MQIVIDLLQFFLPDSLEEMGDVAFYGTGITEIIIPMHVNKINVSTKGGDCFPFKGATCLKKIEVAEDNVNYSSYEGCLYSKDKETLIMCPEGKQTVKLYDGVETIGFKAFEYCSLIKDVIIPDGVITIGASSFHDCIGLKTIVIPDSVINITDATVYGHPGVFDGCTELVIKCNSGSYAEQYAIENGISYGSIEIAVHTHSYTEEITKCATCINSGIKTYTCISCGDTYTEEIPATGHTIVIDEMQPATCTKAGKTEGSHCNVCGEIITAQKEVPATGHTYETILTKATTEQDGSSIKKCNVCGQTVTDAIIYYPKNITLSKTDYIYNGKEKKPLVTVIDSVGNEIGSENYTISYSNNKKVGKSVVTIKFNGNYTGMIQKVFTIKPKGTSILKISSKKKGFIVKWKKQTNQTSGYQIQYSTSSKFTKKMTDNVAITKNNTISKNISKLKAKKTYYVRIRTYKMVKVDGKSTKIYSEWSKSKKIKTK